MKTTCALLMLLSLAACARQPVEPTGIYRLGTAEKTMVLEVRLSGDYVLQIDGPDRMSDEIRGRWEDQRAIGTGLTLHGLVWHGDEPEAARAFWPATFDSEGAICLDGSEQLCFTKDKNA